MGQQISISEIADLLPSLKGYALALTGSVHGADDLLQDTLERAWRNRDRFIVGASVKAWLCAIMRHRYIDGVRQDKWTVQDVDGASAGKLTTDPTQQWSLHYADLLREVERLSPAAQAAVALCWFGGMSHQDAANVLDWPLGTLKARVRRAREKLMGALDLGEMNAGDF